MKWLLILALAVEILGIPWFIMALDKWIVAGPEYRFGLAMNGLAGYVLIMAVTGWGLFRVTERKEPPR